MVWNRFLNGKRLRLSQVDDNRLKISNDTDSRNPFESDFGRVIFSSACRRLHDKTQVFPLTTDDNIHSRLTHSLEVMNIGLSFAIYLCGNKEFKKKTNLDTEDILRKISPILKTSCLVHDIGNPPFGHFGETVIREWFRANMSKLSLKGKTLDKWLTPQMQNDFYHFEGNAQGLRLVTKLHFLVDENGMNLTKALLGTIIKYPVSSLEINRSSKVETVGVAVTLSASVNKDATNKSVV